MFDHFTYLFSVRDGARHALAPAKSVAFAILAAQVETRLFGLLHHQTTN